MFSGIAIYMTFGVWVLSLDVLGFGFYDWVVFLLQMDFWAVSISVMNRHLRTLLSAFL